MTKIGNRTPTLSNKKEEADQFIVLEGKTRTSF